MTSRQLRKYCALDDEGKQLLQIGDGQTWACRPAPTTASCAWPAPSPTWKAAKTSSQPHVSEAINYRSLDRKLWKR